MKKIESTIIAIDFDGTCVADDFPRVGRDIGAAPVLKKLVEAGHKLVLWTCRSGMPTENDSNCSLKDAIQGFKDNGIELYRINPLFDNLKWSTSPKVFANLYIDNQSANMFLTDDGFVDWHELEKGLIDNFYLSNEKEKDLENARKHAAETWLADFKKEYADVQNFINEVRGRK